MSEAYIVLGPPRTGTSLTMGLLVNLGIHGGGNYRTGTGNPCYYENKVLYDWVEQRVSAQKVVNTIAKSPKWGMKHPRLAKRWEEFESIIENPHFIVTHRNLPSQLQSRHQQIRRESNEASKQFIEGYYQDVEEITKDRPRLDVWFNAWFINGEQLQTLAEFIGLPVCQKARKLVDPTLRHFT